MPLEAAVLQILQNGQLRGDAGTERVRELTLLYALCEAPRRHPADAKAGGKRLGKRRAVQDEPVPVERLRGRRTHAVEVELRIDVVFDERYLVTTQQCDQRALLVVWHAAAERVLKAGHQPARLDPMSSQRLLQRREVYPRAGIGRHLHRTQPLGLDDLQSCIKSRR